MEPVGILTTMDNPFLTGYIASLKSAGVTNFAVICDSKGLTDNQQSLICARTGAWNISDHFQYNIKADNPMNPFYFVDSHNSQDMLALIKKRGFRFLINTGTPRKLNKSILESTQHGLLNIHPGSLPKYRGKNCPEWAVYYGDKVIITAHIMDTEYDVGKVLSTTEIDWQAHNTYVDFRRDIYLKSFELAASVAKSIMNGTEQILFVSNGSEKDSKIHQAMSPEIFKEVQRKFKINE